MASVLDWVAGEGFREFFGQSRENFPWASAQEFRQRFITGALRGQLPQV